MNYREIRETFRGLHVLETDIILSQEPETEFHVNAFRLICSKLRKLEAGKDRPVDMQPLVRWYNEGPDQFYILNIELLKPDTNEYVVRYADKESTLKWFELNDTGTPGDEAIDVRGGG